MKQRAAYVFRIKFGVPLMWQEGYYERVLRSDEATDVAVRYVLDNPVRAGLVLRHEDYPFMGAKYWPEASSAGLVRWWAGLVRPAGRG